MPFVSGQHQGSLRGAAITKANADVFVPELWSSEVKRFLDQKLIASRYMKTIPFRGKKGDRIHIPNISRASVNRKLPETPVVLQARSEVDYFFDIDTYMESSYAIEDIVDIQASYNLRSEYTREAGYALARDIDNSVLSLRAALHAVPTQRVFSSADGTINGNSKTLDYASILTAKLILDRADVPAEGRILIVSPTQYNQLLAIDKFINMDYQNGAPVNTGQVGRIFNIPVVMTSQIGANSTTGYVNGTGAAAQPTPGVTGSPYLPTQDPFTGLPTAFGGSNTGTNAEVHTALLCHSDYAVIGMQQEPKAESSRQTLYLMDAFVMSQLYGMKLFRPDHAVVIHTNGSIPAVT